LCQAHALTRRKPLQGGEISQSHAENSVPVFLSVNRFFAGLVRPIPSGMFPG
jgi:hypothetical protein